MKLQRRHFLLSYFKILSVDPAGVRTRDLPHDSPTLNQLSHRCAVEIKFLRTFCCQLKKTVFSQKEVRLNMFSASEKFPISDLIGTHSLPSNGWSYKVNCRGLCHASKLALIQPLSTTLDGTVETAVSRAFLCSNSAVIKDGAY